MDNITIQQNIFESVQRFLVDSIYQLRGHRIDTDEIVIYAPDYFMRSYLHYLREKISFAPDFPVNRFMNVKIIDNYNNTIVVAPKNIHLMDLHPFIFNL